VILSSLFNYASSWATMFASDRASAKRNDSLRASTPLSVSTVTPDSSVASDWAYNFKAFVALIAP